MLGFNRWHLFMVSAATLCSAAVAWLALAYFIPAPPSTISMAVGGKGGSYELLAARYKEILARAHVELEFRYAAGGSEHFGLLQDQNSGVNAAFVQGGVSDSKQS